MKKIILVVIDGLGDKPIPQLKNKTPLEAALTPNLDLLAKEGICGLVFPFRFGSLPHSDTAHLALFGYDPRIYYLGRGPYEAAGIGINLKKGDIALRVNFATVDEDLRVIDRRAGRISQTESLVRSIKSIKIKGVNFVLKKSYGHRAVLVLKGKNISSAVTDGDPRETGKKVKRILPLCLARCGAKELKKSRFTADILNEYLDKTHQILENHPLNKKRKKQGLLPANYLLVRGSGEFRKTSSFKERYNLKACCIAGGALYKGIGKILGMKLIKVKGANGLPNTNLRGKFLAAKKNIERYDFVFLHIKATDNLAEDGNFLGKKEFIERIDKSIKPLLSLKSVLVVVTADHSTCCLLKRHCLDPVPILIFGNGKDKVNQFCEKVCRKGKLGKIKQLNLMPTILTLARKNS